MSTVVFLAPAAFADVTCRAEVDRQRAAPGENVVLTLHAASQGSQPPRYELPVIPGVDVVTGGTSQSFSLDGSGSSIAITAVYYLRSRGDADYLIPAISFHAGQRQCTTEPIAISIEGQVPGTGKMAPIPPADQPPANHTPGQSSGHQTNKMAHREAGQPGDPAYITLQVDRHDAWVGQQIILTFRYHRLRSVFGQPSYTAPRTEGFWRLDLPPERSFRQAAAGQIYEVTEIRYALFPTRAGDLIIEPARLILAGDVFGRFFGRGGRQQQLATDPLAVKVRDWPSPRPPGFSGIVASQLAFTAKLDRREVPRGEPATLSLHVSADAFLKSFKGLAVPEPPGVRLFDSTETLREDTYGQRYMAIFTQEKAVVPLQEGLLSLPPLELVYFNTDDNHYMTVFAETPALLVTPSDLPVAGDDHSGFRRAEIARIGSDLAFIHLAAGTLRRQAPPLVQQFFWWFMFLTPWCLLCGYRWRLKRQAMAESDPAGRRRRRAWLQAKHSLRRLSRHGGQAVELTHAILKFAADHMNRSPAGLTATEVQTWCEDHGQAHAGQSLAAILARCDHVRFGGQGCVDVAALATEVMGLLASLEKTVGAGRRGPRRMISRSPAAFTVLMRNLTMALPLVLPLTMPMGVAVALAMSLAMALVPGPGFDAMAAVSGPDPARYLAEGNQAYTVGDLDAALRLYRQALDNKVDDAVLHYNIANTLARRGELGRAIASYLRAQRLAPRDRDVRANLAWVRANTRDLELVGKDLPLVIAQLDAVVHMLAWDEWAHLLVLLSWMTVFLVAWTWRRSWLMPAWRRWRLLLVGLTLMAAAAVATRWYTEAIRDVAVIVVEQVAVHSGPADSFPVVFRVHDGLTIEFRGDRDGWAQIGLGGDWVGWVPVDALERVRRP